MVASAIACLAIAGFLFTQIDMELMPAGSTNTISVSVETRSGLDLENTNAIMEEIESMISEDPDVESCSLRVSGGGMGMMAAVLPVRCPSPSRTTPRWIPTPMCEPA